jgi:CheY-like chemotaxis protein
MTGHIKLLSAGEGFGTTALVDIPVLARPKKRRAHSDPSFDRSTIRTREDDSQRRASVIEGQQKPPEVATRLRSSTNDDTEEESGVAGNASPANPAQSTMLDKCTVILAEDNAFSRIVIKAMLSKLGTQRIVEVSDGDQLITAVREREEDIANGSCVIVLTDLEMPEVTGYEAMRQIRFFAPGVPIIVLSAHTFTEYREKAEECGANAFLNKPLKLGELEAAIRAVCEQKPEVASPRTERERTRLI